MTDADRVEFTHGHPVPTRDHAVLLASRHLLLQLAEVCLPVRMRFTDKTSYFESWEITRAAFMARMSSTLRHLGYLVPSYSRLDGLALARTLIDHVITFAWIGAEPKTRLPRFLYDSVEDQLLKDDRVRQRGRDPLLADPERARLLRYLHARLAQLEGDDSPREDRGKLPKLSPRQREFLKVPTLWRCSREADEGWRERIASSLPSELAFVNFSELYSDIYDYYAASDHPTTLGLQNFVHLPGHPVVEVDGLPERGLEEDLRPYWMSVFAFSYALVISELATGRPRLGPLRQALETIGVMRLAERDGRLEITTNENGTTIGLQ